MNARNLFLCLLYLSLFFFFYWQSVAVWFLFLVLALRQLYLLFSPVLNSKDKQVIAHQSDSVEYGRLGYWRPEGEDDDLCFGLFIDLAGKGVFVDIAEDENLEERKTRAIELYERAAELESSLSKFLATHPEYSHRQVSSIGLHSPDLSRAEVFWNPSGYTLLRDLEFGE